MITCPFCQAINLDNANFCSNCGKPFPEEIKQESKAAAADILATEAADIERETDPVADATMEALAREVPGTTALRPVSAREREPVAIRLKIGEPQRELVMPLDQIIHIGRQDPSLDLFPEIDVTNDGDAAKSVSRRHAKILKQEGLLLIVDEGSSNGTFVNQKRLKSFEYTLLRDGDIVLLGKLKVEVEILTS